LHGDKLLRTLGRLVSYKIRQINLLDSPVITENIWRSIEDSFLKENRYAKNAHFDKLKNNYNRAMWAYYEILEVKALAELGKLKDEVYRQIKTSEVKRNFTIGQ
jgi:hypothetical protein